MRLRIAIGPISMLLVLLLTSLVMPHGPLHECGHDEHVMGHLAGDGAFVDLDDHCAICDMVVPAYRACASIALPAVAVFVACSISSDDEQLLLDPTDRRSGRGPPMLI